MRARLLALAVLPLMILTACGGSDDSDEGSEAFTGLKGVSVTGGFGETPVLEAEKVSFENVTVETIVVGDGPAASKDGNTITNIGVWSGVDGTPLLGWSGDAAFVVNANTSLMYGLAEVVDGVTEGSRIVFAMPVLKAIQPAVASELGLEETDNLIGVIDVTGSVAAGPEGEAQTPPAGTPGLIESNGAVTGFDWDSAAEKAPTDLQVVPLIKGTGPAVELDQDLIVNYLGAVWGSETAFDQSYDSNPSSFALSEGMLIDGWVEGLQGVTVGSRVLLVIPPDKGYGDNPPSTSEIPAGATLVFVVDILAAS